MSPEPAAAVCIVLQCQQQGLHCIAPAFQADVNSLWPMGCCHFFLCCLHQLLLMQGSAAAGDALMCCHQELLHATRSCPLTQAPSLSSSSGDTFRASDLDVQQTQHPQPKLPLEVRALHTSGRLLEP